MTMKPHFASETSVPVERSRVELEKLLRRYEADQFVSGWEEGRAMVGFRIAGRTVRLEVPMPTLKDVERDGANRRRSPAQKTAALAQMERQRWRALLLLTKAKLEACALGLETFEQAFLAGIVTPNGQTIGQRLVQQLDEIQKGGAIKLLPGAP
jgi:hypothetical protein